MNGQIANLLFGVALTVIIGACDSSTNRQSNSDTAIDGASSNAIKNANLDTFEEEFRAGQVANEEKQQTADIRILFIGNSHTQFHDVPKLVAQMIEHQKPKEKVYVRTLGVNFLDDIAANPAYKKELASQRWNFVVLQGQKISMSGKFDYSKKEGIDFAKLAQAHGATVYFFAEWGRKGIEGDGETIHKIYEAMAQTAKVSVAPVGRAWDLALGKQPDIPLYAADGNHESSQGAFLTAAVLCGQITGESPAVLESFDYRGLDKKNRVLLANAAATALNFQAKDSQDR